MERRHSRECGRSKLDSMDLKKREKRGHKTGGGEGGVVNLGGGGGEG